MHDPRAPRQLLADRTLRWAPGLHAVQRGRPPRGTEAGRPALRLPQTEASLFRQIHAGRWPLHPDVLRAVDGDGPGARATLPEHWQHALLRRSIRGDSADR